MRVRQAHERFSCRTVSWFHKSNSVSLILVTGARGAIGQHVVAEARRRGHRVIGLGHGAWTGEPGLPAIDGWISGGVDTDNLAILMRREGKPDAVVHLAGGALVGPSIAHPGEDFRRTVESAQRLLEWLRLDAPRTPLVMASSAAVYGNAHAEPIEEDTEYAPASPYGTHKAMAEMLVRSYARQFGQPAAIVRLFSVYGSGLRKQLIWELGNRLARGEHDWTLGGTGSEQRDFLHIADAARMLLDAVPLADVSAPAFNGCTGRAIRIDALARLIARREPGVSISFSGQSRAGDPICLVGSATKARMAGLTAPTSLESGIGATIDWILRATRRATS